MDLQISGRTAVISGAAGAIACETARILLEEGCRLILSDIDADELQTSVERLDGGDDVRAVIADLGEPEGAEKIQHEGVRGEPEWQPGLLLHAAGVTGAKGDPLDDITEVDWNHAWNIDFMTSVRMAKTFIPPMREAGWGRAVFVTSENVAQPYPDEAVYNAAKAALLSFAKSMSQLYARQGVLVNCVAPAFIETDMTDGMMEKRAQQRGTDMQEAIASFLDEERPHLTLKRRGRPEEVAFITACLLSERASFVNGANYRVDGGAVQALNI
ncbi:MAG TPA: SDR family oxidoreductase [Salinisphaeraceae bacterium]|nr:SDR family oxidoreductase [Salinisphaeraceae bacterium]